MLFLWLTLKVDLVILAGVLLAICLRRAADRVNGLTGIPVGGTLALVVLLVLGFFAGMGWFFSQAIASQIDQLSQQLPAAAAKLGSILGQSSVGKILMEHMSSTGIKQSPIAMLQNFFGVATNAVEVVGAIAVMIFLGLYFAAEANLYVSGLVRLVPHGRRARLRRNTARDRERYLVLDAGPARVDDDTRISGRDRPVDNRCSAAGGAGISGRYSDLCPIYRRVRFGDTESAARRFRQSGAGDICGLALSRCSSHRGLHPRTAGTTTGVASAPGADLVGANRSQRPRRVSRPAVGNAARRCRPRHHSDGLC